MTSPLPPPWPSVQLVDGLPLHPLVVHGVVVLLPLAALGTVAIALRPAWRVRYGWVVVALAAVSTALVPVATSSGDELSRSVGMPGDHARLGETLLFFTVPLLVLVLAMVLLEHRRARRATSPGTSAEPDPGQRGDAVRSAVAVLAVVAALAASVQVYRIGDSGARAVWEDRVAGA